MKCNKCGQSISEDDTFCAKCGERIIKEVIQNREKANHKLFVIFAIEIVLVILIAVGISIYYSKSFENKIVTQKEFKENLTQNGYIIEDAKDATSKGIKSYDFATIDDQNLGIHYIVAESDKDAMNVFNNLYYQIKSQAKSGFISEVSVDLIGYNYYSLEDSGNYYVIVKNGDTIFASTGPSQSKNKINTMVEEFGFGYSSSVLYVIMSIVIVVFILMIVIMWKIFVKSGRKGWQSLIPFYNCYCLSKITFNKGWFFILMLITPINIVFMPVTFYKLAKRFGKSTTFAVCSIFFPYVTMQIIAFDNSKYINENEG